MIRNKVFFAKGVPVDGVDLGVDLSVFESYEDAYHQLMVDLTYLGLNSLQLVIPERDITQSVYVTGGFARNEIFVRLLATLLPTKLVFTSEIDNATALGAAMVLWNKAFTGTETKMDLGLKKIEPFVLGL